jgi:hypothetical protein
MKNLVEKIFYFQNQLQLKHWQEQKGFAHHLQGEYYTHLNSQFDLLVECYMSTSKDLTATETAYILINHIDIVETYNNELRKFISEMRTEFVESPALLNILDDISTLVEKYNYLLEKE